MLAVIQNLAIRLVLLDYSSRTQVQYKFKCSQFSSSVLTKIILIIINNLSSDIIQERDKLKL